MAIIQSTPPPSHVLVAYCQSDMEYKEMNSLFCTQCNLMSFHVSLFLLVFLAMCMRGLSMWRLRIVNQEEGPR